MRPLVSPWSVSQWNRPAIFAERRAAYLAMVYPSGPPISGVDAVSLNYTVQGPSPMPPVSPLPTGCAQIDLYTNLTPGGRSGGTPTYQLLLHPTASFNGVCLVWLNGHTAYSGVQWWLNTVYCIPGASVILDALALGCRLLVIDMPSAGYNPGAGGNPTAQVIYYAGATHVVAGEAFDPLNLDGGPICTCMYVDQVIRAMNQYQADYGPPSSWWLVGHSG